MILALTVVTVLSCLTLSVLFFHHHAPRSPFRALGLLCLCLAAWSTTNWLSIQNFSHAEKFFWIKVVMAVTAPIPVLFLEFTLRFRRKESVLKRWMPMLSLWSVGLIVLSFSPFMFERYSVVNQLPALAPGWAAMLYGLTFLTLSSISTWMLIDVFRTQKGLAKAQSAYILLGLCLTIVVGFLTNFVCVALLGNFYFVAVGPSASLFLVAAMSYAMLRLRLLNLRLAIIRCVAYLSTVLVISIVYSVAMSDFIHRQLLQFSVSSERVITLATTVAALLTFPSVLKVMHKWTQRVFYRSAFVAENAHQLLSQIISRSLTLKMLFTEVEQFFLKQFHMSKAEIVTSAHSSEESERLTRFFAEGHSLLVADELVEGPLKLQLRERGCAVVIPLHRLGKEFGWICLGHKQNGDAFSAEELQFCEVVGPQLALAVDHLRQVEQMKDDFVSIASHELRTPMTAIKSYLWLCLYKQQVTVPDTVREHIRIAYNATERLLELVKDLLTLSQLESQHLPLKTKSVTLRELVDRVISELTTLAESKSLKISVIQTAEDTSCIVDEGKVINILQNLLGNAIKFSPIEGEVEVVIGGDAYQVVVHVSDNGPGISKSDQERLFQKFGVIQQSYRKSPESGTGLGLYISQQFAKLHRGVISMTSTLGVGSTFTLRLPRQLALNAKTIDLTY
jgi:signal transduction histidine kinase